MKCQFALKISCIGALWKNMLRRNGQTGITPPWRQSGPSSPFTFWRSPRSSSRRPTYCRSQSPAGFLSAKAGPRALRPPRYGRRSLGPIGHAWLSPPPEVGCPHGGLSPFPDVSPRTRAGPSTRSARFGAKVQDKHTRLPTCHESRVRESAHRASSTGGRRLTRPR